MTDKQAVPLMPCPFCGKEPSHVECMEYGSFAVWCYCGATGPRHEDADAHADSLQAWDGTAALWNNRHVVIPAITREALREALDPRYAKTGPLVWHEDKIIAALERLGVKIGE